MLLKLLAAKILIGSLLCDENNASCGLIVPVTDYDS